MSDKFKNALYGGLVGYAYYYILKFVVGSVLGLSWLKKWVWLAGFIFTGVLVLVALVFVVLPIFFHSLRDPPFIVAIYDKVDISSLCLLGVMMMCGMVVIHPL